MPKVALTAQQKRQRACERLNGAVADGLAVYKARHRMTNAQLGESIGVGRVAVSAILAGKSVQLHSEQFWRVLGAAGLTVSRPKFEGEVTAQ